MLQAERLALQEVHYQPAVQRLVVELLQRGTSHHQAEATPACRTGWGPGRVSQEDGTSSSQVLCIVSCAAPPALDVHILIELAQQDGWDVCLIATPRAFQWIDVSGLSSRPGIRFAMTTSCLVSLTCCPNPMRLWSLRRRSTPSTSGQRGIADTLAPRATV